MKGHIIVKKLNKSGNYISELDYDKTFVDSSNKKGLFKMLIQPIKNNENKNEIKYIKEKDFYIVSGEAYIISGRSETEINKRINKYCEHYDEVLLTKVNSKDELW